MSAGSHDGSPAPALRAFGSYTWRERWLLAWGKLRRFYLLRFRPDYVRRSLARRVGECHRTGACCELLFRCPLLERFDRLPFCRIYRRRPLNCTIFPIDERDLRDRDIVSPHRPCGFSFVSAEEGDARRASEPARKVETVLHV